MTKPVRVIEDGNHLWKHTVDGDVLRFRDRERRVFGVSRPSRFSALAISVGSVTGCAWAAIESPVIAIGSETSGSTVNEIRLSRERFALFDFVGCTGNKSSGHH